MNRRQVGLVLSLVLALGCANQKPDFEEVLTDRVWRWKDQSQFYFSSQNQEYYLWLTIEHRDGKTYTPFEEAQGTPYTHPITSASRAKKQQGWTLTGYWKIVGDSLYVQDDDDPKADRLRRDHLQLLSDTTIGVFDYNRVQVTNQYASKVYLSKKR